LQALINLYPNDISRDELAEQTDFAAGSGGFNNNLSNLKTRGAIEYPTKGKVKASQLLFPERII